mgnify:CR=1 FL=1
MKMPTEKQIESEIKKLAKIQQMVLPYSAFGDDHRAAIAAQIVVLEERLTEDDVWDRYGDDAENIRENAEEAARWLEGDTDEKTLSENWACLVQK